MIDESKPVEGAWWKDAEVGAVIDVKTKNTVYRIERRDDGDYVSGHSVYCPTPTKAAIVGSTWGGTMLKMGWIGIGMHLEFSTREHHRVTTTPIVDIQTVNRPGRLGWDRLIVTFMLLFFTLLHGAALAQRGRVRLDRFGGREPRMETGRRLPTAYPLRPCGIYDLSWHGPCR